MSVLSEVAALREEGYTDEEILEELGLDALPGSEPAPPEVSTASPTPVRKLDWASPGEAAVRVRREDEIEELRIAEELGGRRAARLARFEVSRASMVVRLARALVKVNGFDWYAVTGPQRKAAYAWARRTLEVIEQVEADIELTEELGVREDRIDRMRR